MGPLNYRRSIGSHGSAIFGGKARWALQGNKRKKGYKSRLSDGSAAPADQAFFLLFLFALQACAAGLRQSIALRAQRWRWGEWLPLTRSKKLAM
jgi:hypothetical protein